SLISRNTLSKFMICMFLAPWHEPRYWSDWLVDSLRRQVLSKVFPNAPTTAQTKDKRQPTRQFRFPRSEASLERKRCRTRAGRQKSRLPKLRMSIMRTKQAPTVTAITTFALLLSMCASFTFSQRSSAQVNEESSNATEFSALSAYAVDLTK